MAAPRSIPAAGRIRRLVAGIAVTAALAAGGAVATAAPALASHGDTVAAAAETPSPTPTPGSTVRSECPVAIPDGYADRVECGELLVSERRGDSADTGAVIVLPYAIISSTSSDPAPDPLVFTGGAGVDALGALEYFLTRGWWATSSRDVILLEQRGDLLAEPTLDCPEVSAENLTVDGVYLTGAAGAEARQALLAACWERVTATGVDLGGYASRSTAADLAELRTALGYDTWNLYGLGYGTRVALTVMRDRPEGLRSVILDAPAPLQRDAVTAAPADLAGAVDRLVSSCAADAACAERYPDLAGNIVGVLETAADSPFALTVDSPADGGSIRLELDDTTLAQGLVRSLADAALVPSLPFIIDQLAQGNADAALPLAQTLLDADGRGSEGMLLSQQCAEVLPFVDEQAADEAYAADPIASHLGDPALLADCAAWTVAPLSEREAAAVSSDIPTLVTVGGFDPLAPGAAAEATVESLPAGASTLFSRLSHGSIWQSDVNRCAALVASQFLADPAVAPDAACIENQPQILYPTTAAIDPTTALYRLDRDLVQQREPVSIGFLVATLLIMLATLGYGIVVALGRRVRLRGDIPAGAVAAAVMAASFNLVYALGIAVIYATSDPISRALGIPAAAWPLLLLPFAGIVMSILLVVLLVRAWVQDDGTLTHRIILSASAAGSLIFTVWLLVHGLLML